MPEIRPSVISRLSNKERTSEHKMKHYVDKGQPCQSPVVDESFYEALPFTSTTKLDFRMQPLIHLIYVLEKPIPQHIPEKGPIYTVIYPLHIEFRHDQVVKRVGVFQ